MKTFVVERARCEGHGVCVDVAPDLLDLDDEGELTILQSQVGAKDEAAANEAVLVCPVTALRLISAAPGRAG